MRELTVSSVQHSTLRTNARASGLIFIFVPSVGLFAIYSYGLLCVG